MNIKQIRISNFMCYGEDVVINLNNGIYAIVGEINGIEGDSNGSGKSALVQAITWCFWGEAYGTDKYPAADHLIRHTPKIYDHMSVEIDYGQFIISRARTRGKSTILQLINSGQDMSSNKLADTQKQIDAVLGETFDLFLTTAYFRQKDSGGFIGVKPTEAKTKILEMLALSRWNHRHKTARSEFNQVQEKCISLEGEFQGINAVINPTLIGECEKSLLDLSGRRNKLDLSLKGLNSALKKYEIAYKTATEVVGNSKLFGSWKCKEEGLLADIEEAKNEFGVIYDVLKHDREQLVRITQEIPDTGTETFDTIIAALDHEEELLIHDRDEPTRKEARRQAEKIILLNSQKIDTLRQSEQKYIDMAVCPECERELTDIERTEKLDVIRQELKRLVDTSIAQNKIVDDIDVEIIEYERRLDVIQGNKKTMREQLAELQDLISLGSKFEDAIERSEIQIKAIESNIKNLGKMLADHMERQVTFDPDAEENLNAAETKLNACKTKITTVELAIKDVDKSMVELETRKAAQIEQQKLSEIVEVKLRDAQQERGVLELVVNAFSAKGIPSYIVHKVVPEIELMTNNILRRAGVGFSIRIDLTRENKTGGNTDTFAINVYNTAGVIQMIVGYSGGESWWIDCAIRLALYVIMNNSRSVDLMKLLIIDEGLGKIDSNARSRLIAMLQYIQSEFGIDQILLITHSDILTGRELFAGTIKIEKKNHIADAVLI